MQLILVRATLPRRPTPRQIPPYPRGRLDSRVRALRFWPLVVALLLVGAFCSLELRAVGPARASFTLVGLADCGLRSGQSCSFGGTLVVVSSDGGTPTLYTIDVS